MPHIMQKSCTHMTHIMRTSHTVQHITHVPYLDKPASLQPRDGCATRWTVSSVRPPRHSGCAAFCKPESVSASAEIRDEKKKKKYPIAKDTCAIAMFAASINVCARATQALNIKFIFSFSCRFPQKEQKKKKKKKNLVELRVGRPTLHIVRREVPDTL